MFFHSDLRFLCDIFKKCHIKTKLLSPDEPIGAALMDELSSVLCIEQSPVPARDFFGNATKTIFKIRGQFSFSFVCIPLMPAEDNYLFIGPFLPSPVSKEEAFEMAEACGISQKATRYFCEHFANVPVISPSDSIFSVIVTFCERLWNVSSFSVVELDIGAEQGKPNIASNEKIDDAVSIRALETRYKFENELMNAVTLGQIHRENELVGAITEPFIEKRVSDPVRNIKNYSIIMNTLLRKAAERGGVHPVHLDTTSSAFAKKIEQLPASADGAALMSEMFRAYCRLVRKHSLKDYSPAVSKAIITIDSDLAADLSLTSLAAKQNISPGYLSAVFKKDTGKTVSEYIREKRIAHAAHLLAETHLQIQTVALHCGIMDVQYFSKLFKRETGKTPKEYRESTKK